MQRLSLAILVVSVSTSASFAEPRILTLPDRSEATLPGGSTEASGTITIRRGSGFPIPEAETVEAPAEEAEPEAPAETRRIIIRRNRSGY
ncbi:MAG: hypothetical protein AAF718_17025 [Pseudomonadota bacterium]